MRWLFLFLIYAAFGLAFMTVFDEAGMIRVSDASFWAWLLGWPVIVGLKMMKWMVIFVVIICAIAGFIAWKESRL